MKTEIKIELGTVYTDTTRAFDSAESNRCLEFGIKTGFSMPHVWHWAPTVYYHGAWNDLTIEFGEQIDTVPCSPSDLEDAVDAAAEIFADEKWEYRPCDKIDFTTTTEAARYIWENSDDNSEPIAVEEAARLLNDWWPNADIDAEDLAEAYNRIIEED